MTEQGLRWGYDPKDGGFSERTFKGLSAAKNSIIPILISQGYRVEVDEGPGDLCTVRASSNKIPIDSNGTTDPPVVQNEVVSTWELSPNKSTKDILQADCAAINQLTTEMVEQLRFIQANRPAPEDTPAWIDSAKQYPIYKLINAGVEHWEVDQPILKHTYAVPVGINPGFAFTNIRKIFTVATLLSTEGLPASFLLSLAAIFADSDPTRTDGVALTYGFKKEMPTLQVEYGGKQSVTVEYKFGLWSTLLYGAAI